MAASVSFGRFGGCSFPEICSSSPSGVQETCYFPQRNHARSVYVVCSAAAGDAASLPRPPGEFLLEEVKRKRREFASLMNKNGGNWNSKLPFWAERTFRERELTKKIMELSQKRRLDEIFELLKLPATKTLVNRKTMNAVMDACVNCGDIYRTMELFQCMKQPEACGVDEITYGTLIKGLGKAGMLDAAFQVLESMDLGTAPGKPRLSVIHLNTLINACANAGDARRARGALKRYSSLLKDSGPSLITYNMLIKGYARSDNPLEAIKVKEELQLRGMEPNKLTWNSLILACVRGQEMDVALQVFAEMKEAAIMNAEVTPDVVTYTTLLQGLAETGNLSGVRNMVTVMKEMRTCVIDRAGYTAIIDACITAGAPAEALTLFETMETMAMKDRRLKPRAHSYLALMRALSETGDVDTVSLLQKRMISNSCGHVWPEERLEANELLLEAAVNNGETTLGQKILRTIMGSKRDINLSERGYSAIIRLQAMTDFVDNTLSPVILGDKYSLTAPLMAILPEMTTLQPLSSCDKLEKTVLRFFEEDVLPVSDEDGKCIGLVHSKDCHKMNLLFTDVMRDPPPVLSSTVSIETAIDALLQPNVSVLAVKTGSQSVSFLTRKLLLDFLSQNSTR